MSHEEAKLAVLEGWDRWIKVQPGSASLVGRDALRFFLELRSSNTPLLDFQTPVRDKWQVIHGWLLEAGRVSD